MPRKRIPPIVERAFNLLKLSLLMAKFGKPITARLILFKKSRKLKKLKLLKHYNYDFVKEYEFSPSSTPLFHHYNKNTFKKRSRGGGGDMYSLLSPCGCWGSFEFEEEEGNELRYEVEALPDMEDDGIEQVPLESSTTTCVEDDDVRELPLVAWDSSSVDERAEMFIRKFYEDMRIQRQDTVLQLQRNA